MNTRTIIIAIACGVALIALTAIITAWQASPLPLHKMEQAKGSLATLEMRLHDVFKEYPQATAYCEDGQGRTDEERKALNELHGIYLRGLGGIEERLNRQTDSRWRVRHDLRRIKKAARLFLRRTDDYDFLKGFVESHDERVALKKFFRKDPVF